MYSPEPEEKFDYQNMDVKLYLALKVLAKDVEDAIACGAYNHINDSSFHGANRAMYEFEQSFGPLPDWAIARNWDYSLVPGAQLLTKDGRQHGNGHIIKMYNQFIGSDVNVFEILTDAGSKITFIEVELNNSFYIGDWISSVDRILNDFDRNGEFRDEQ